jgi:hypothetical protein
MKARARFGGERESIPQLFYRVDEEEASQKQTTLRGPPVKAKREKVSEEEKDEADGNAPNRRLRAHGCRDANDDKTEQRWNDDGDGKLRENGKTTTPGEPFGQSSARGGKLECRQRCRRPGQ